MPWLFLKSRTVSLASLADRENVADVIVLTDLTKGITSLTSNCSA